MWIALAIVAVVGLALLKGSKTVGAPPPPPLLPARVLTPVGRAGFAASALKNVGAALEPFSTLTTVANPDDTISREIGFAAPVVLATIGSIVGGALAFVALAILEIEFFVNAFEADQDLLKHGRQGALDDFVSLACHVRDGVRPYLLQAGCSSQQATAIAMLYGWYAAAGANTSATSWVAKNGTGYVGVTESQADHMNHWADRGLFVAADAVSDTTLGPTDPHTVNAISYLSNSPQIPLPGYTAGQQIFNDPTVNSYVAALQAAGPGWPQGLDVQAGALGMFLWASKGLFAGYDDQFLTGDPSLVSNHWNILGHGDSGSQAAWFYTDSHIINGALDPTSSTVTDASGIVWDAERTQSSGKPVLAYKGVG